MKVEVRIGIPKTLVSNDEELEELKKNILGEYLDKFAGVGATEKDIDVVIDKTNGEFYTRISGEEDSGNVPMEPESTKTIDVKEPINLKEVLSKDEQGNSFDNSDISEDQEKACSEDDDICYDGDECCDDWCCCEEDQAELSRIGENIALLKLYLMLSNNDGWEELHTKYGSTHIDCLEKQFLLNKLFEQTGLDAIVKDIEKTLDKAR